MTANTLGCELWWVRNVIHDPEAVEGEGSSSFHAVFSWLIVLVSLKGIMIISSFCHRNPC